MSCSDKIKTRCRKVSSECVSYDRDLPTFSELDDCVTIAETTEELYNIIGDIKNDLNLSELDPECLTFPTNLTIKSLFQLLITTICTQQETINTLQGTVETMTTQIEDLQQNNCP